MGKRRDAREKQLRAQVKKLEAHLSVVRDLEKALMLNVDAVYSELEDVMLGRGLFK